MASRKIFQHFLQAIFFMFILLKEKDTPENIYFFVNADKNLTLS